MSAQMPARDESVQKICRCINAGQPRPSKPVRCGCGPKDSAVMIKLTRLNNRPLVVNSELIKFIENAPDTVITLITGEKLVVLETAEEIMDQIVEYRRRILAPPASVPPLEAPRERPENLTEDEK